MPSVNVLINYVLAERLWPADKPIKGKVEINSNLSVVGVERVSDNRAKIPFVLTVNYMPPVAQINLKGTAYVAGKKSEIDEIAEKAKKGSPLPVQIMQAISNVVLIEATIVSRTIGVPPPVPLPVIGMGPPPKREGPSYVA